eukprot:symbB.v1.2.029920.t1/scaffold3323.1/size59064/6
MAAAFALVMVQEKFPVNKGLSKEKCHAQLRQNSLGGEMGWSSSCPRSALEAEKLLKAPPISSPKPGNDTESDPDSSCRHLPEGVRSQKDLPAPFKSGSILEVGCAIGFHPLNESEEFWNVKCVGWDAWSATGHFGGCEVVTCSSMSDTWGTWTGALRFNSTLRLECADGFNVEGASELRCLPSGLWDHLPGQCLPNGGNPELWRSKLRYSALLSFLGIVVTITLVLWVCRPPSEQGPNPLSRQSLATE